MKVSIEIKERKDSICFRLRRGRNSRDTPGETEAGNIMFRSIRSGFKDADRTIIHDEAGDVEFVYEEGKK